MTIYDKILEISFDVEGKTIPVKDASIAVKYTLLIAEGFEDSQKTIDGMMEAILKVCEENNIPFRVTKDYWDKLSPTTIYFDEPLWNAAKQEHHWEEIVLNE